MPLGSFRLNGLVKKGGLPPRTASTISGTINSASAKFGAGAWGLTTAQSGNFTITLPQSIGGTSPCTIEFWAWKGTESGSTPRVIMECTGIGGLQNRLNSGSTWWGIINSSGFVAAQNDNGVATAYNHIAFQPDTSNSGTWWWWVNGSSQESFTGSGNTFNQLNFGRFASSTGVFTIRFDEIRVSSIRRYTNGTSFTTASAEFVNDANTLALFHCNSVSETDDIS
jgi:hypothetical protein